MARGNSALWAQSFVYDRYGNLTQMNPGVDSPPGLNVGVNGNNQITNTGFSYDAAGNSLQDGQGVGSHSYTWDAEERLVQVDSGSTWSYTYNALGQRVEWLQPGVNNEILYDPAGNLVGNWGSWSMVPLGSRNNWAMYINGKTVFSHPNNLGSSVMQTDFSGAVVQDMTYYPWGTVWQSPQAGYVPYFASMIYDGVANKYLTTYRQFSPNLGRWLSPDLGAGNVGFPQTQNLYAYVADNPATLTDPTGLTFCDRHPEAPACQHGSGDVGAIGMGGFGFNDALRSGLPVCGMPTGGGGGGGIGDEGPNDPISCQYCKAVCDTKYIIRTGACLALFYFFRAIVMGVACMRQAALDHSGCLYNCQINQCGEMPTLPPGSGLPIIGPPRIRGFLPARVSR